MDQAAARVALRVVWGSGAKDVLAVGDRGWRAMASGSESALQSIRGSVTESSYDAYAVSEGGTALHFDGSVHGADSTRAPAKPWRISGARPRRWPWAATALS